MARFLVLCALIGVALATPTPPTLPKTILGVFEVVPSESKNFDQFVTVLGLSGTTKFDERNLIGFWQEGDTYKQTLVFWPRSVKFTLPFKLGETQTTTIRGKQFEYVYTVETGATPETPVLRAKFRQTDGDVKFTIEAAFTKDGITVTYATGNVIATRKYVRTLPPYVFGTYEVDNTTPVKQETLDFFNQAFALPGGFKWTKDMKYWIGRYNNTFVQKFFVDPSFYKKMKFNLDEEQTLTMGGRTIKYKLTVVEMGPKTTTLREDVTCPTAGTVVTTSVFDKTGIHTTVKTDKGEHKINYRRILSPFFYGTFEHMPEKQVNWEAFMQGAEDYKETFEESIKSYTLYRKSNDVYAVQRVPTTGEKHDVEFKFPHDGPQTVTLKNGKTLKYNTTVMSCGNRTFIQFDSQVDDKKFTVTEEVKACGTVATFRRGDVEAKRYFRRVVPKTVFGTFESPEMTDAEFKTFAEKHGWADMLKKHTMELSETPDYKIHNKLTMEGKPTPIEFSMRLGEPHEHQMNGKTIKSTLVYMEIEKKPVVRGWKVVDGEVVMEWASVMTPEGFTATYTYDNGMKVAKRTYTRQGTPVPFETLGQ